jgi:hypothetical protein
MFLKEERPDMHLAIADDLDLNMMWNLAPPQ